MGGTTVSAGPQTAVTASSTPAQSQFALHMWSEEAKTNMNSCACAPTQQRPSQRRGPASLRQGKQFTIFTGFALPICPHPASLGPLSPSWLGILCFPSSFLGRALSPQYHWSTPPQKKAYEQCVCLLPDKSQSRGQPSSCLRTTQHLQTLSGNL